MGQHSFAPVIHEKAVLPGIDVPSFKWIPIEGIEYDFEVFNKVKFQKVLIKLPTLKEEEKTENLEKYAYHFLS